MVTRSDELAESSSARYPGVWIQYKGDRARVLQTVEEYGRESLRAAIINEFMGDLEALSLAVPGQSMQDVRVVWGTGQVRATYTIRDAVSGRAPPACAQHLEPYSSTLLTPVWLTFPGIL